MQGYTHYGTPVSSPTSTVTGISATCSGLQRLKRHVAKQDEILARATPMYMYRGIKIPDHHEIQG